MSLTDDIRRLLGLRVGQKVTKADIEAIEFLEKLKREAGQTSTSRQSFRSLPKTRIPREPPRPGEESEYGPEHKVISSNVFSFSYYRPSGDTTGTLYVTYRGHVVNPHAVRNVQVKRGRNTSRAQLRGKLGATVGGKTNQRGPTYAYLRVPPRIYEEMMAAGSTGGFVWDRLRIRGTVHGHQYAYVLMQGQVTPTVGGVYIPRKAAGQVSAGELDELNTALQKQVAKGKISAAKAEQAMRAARSVVSSGRLGGGGRRGFRSRGVAEVGAGRRGFQTSTLPSQRGFSTRR